MLHGRVTHGCWEAGIPTGVGRLVYPRVLHGRVIPTGVTWPGYTHGGREAGIPTVGGRLVYPGWYMQGIPSWYICRYTILGIHTTLLALTWTTVACCVRCAEALGSRKKNPVGKRGSRTLGPQECDGWYASAHRMLPLSWGKRMKDWIASGTFPTVLPWLWVTRGESCTFLTFLGFS